MPRNTIVSVLIIHLCLFNAALSLTAYSRAIDSILLIMNVLNTFSLLVRRAVPLRHRFSIGITRYQRYRNAISDRERFGRKFTFRMIGSDSVFTDANALPDCKRRLGQITSKIDSNLRPEVLDYSMLTSSLKDLEMVSPAFFPPEL